MKRFLKVGAVCVFALALMSISAFAEGVKGTAYFDPSDGELDVSLTGTTAEEQVSIMVLWGDKSLKELASAEEADIAYIDQIVSDGSATLYFQDINVGDAIGKVTVFAGSTYTPNVVRLGVASKTVTPQLFASSPSFNILSGRWSGSLKLTDENVELVTGVDSIQYKLKSSTDELADATSYVRYDEASGTWQFNFASEGTYDVVFTKGEAKVTVYVCVYNGISLPGFGTSGKESVVVEKAIEGTTNKKVLAGVKVQLGTNVANGEGRLIWSIKTADGTRYYTSPVDSNLGVLSDSVDIGCSFTNDTGKTVEAVNIIYKDSDGNVYFTDLTDKGNEQKKF